MRVLILASAFDTTARAVGDHLRARYGQSAVQHRTLEDLAAARWTHRIGASGAHTELRFQDGTTLSDFAPTFFFNRLEFTPTLLFTRMAVDDRDYARTEFYALLLSWLASLGDSVVNRPAPSGLSGPVLRPWLWMARAASVGLIPYPGAATTSARRSPAPLDAVLRPELLSIADDPALAQLGVGRPAAHAPQPQAVLPLLVIGGRVFGDAAGMCGGETAAGCLRLARAVGVDLLGVQLAQCEGDPHWRLLAADARPQVDDESTMAALTDWIETRA
jgi:hypothetical protein